MFVSYALCVCIQKHLFRENFFFFIFNWNFLWRKQQRTHNSNMYNHQIELLWSFKFVFIAKFHFSLYTHIVVNFSRWDISIKFCPIYNFCFFLFKSSIKLVYCVCYCNYKNSKESCAAHRFNIQYLFAFSSCWNCFLISLQCFPSDDSFYDCFAQCFCNSFHWYKSMCTFVCFFFLSKFSMQAGLL